ncbi:fimbria/pilus periplasmic chaperone [Serratia fonticola]|nr:fimbria/pilus periplasmic chaperone [Serratia fonticola]NYA40040.1 fimbria/pilus periplasmic chaperone [Serratia fonticola]
MQFLRRTLQGSFIAMLLAPSMVSATGMIPDSSVVVLEEAEGEVSMNVTNSDESPMLLTTTIQPISQEQEKLLLVSPPAVRVDGGKTQKVRFLLATETPLKTERLRRVIFRGIPPQNKGQNEVRMSISQNLPVIIRPAGLKRDEAPWKRLVWKKTNGMLTVSNDSPYVVRLSQAVQTLPDNAILSLPNSYILPGEHLLLKAPAGKTLAAVQQVRISPATTWGYSVKSYDATVTQ